MDNTMITFEGKTPSRLLIGDEYYLEEMDELAEKIESLAAATPATENAKKATKKDYTDAKKSYNRLKKLILNEKITQSARKIFIDVYEEKEKCEVNGVELDIASSVARIYVVNKKTYKGELATYRKNNYFKKDTIITTELGCDTAGFNIYTEYGNDDSRGMRFDTGADGYYGTAYVFKNAAKTRVNGMIIELSIDADLMSADELANNLKYTFKAN